MTSRISVLLTAALIFMADAHAATITVGPDADCDTASLATAIDRAYFQSGNDEIRISNGVVLSGQAILIQNQSLTLRGGYSSCAASATVVGRSTLEGNGGDSVLSARESDGQSYALTLDRLDIRNGGGGADGVGGGIDIYGQWSVAMRRMDIGGNQTDFDGGGIAIEGVSSNRPAQLELGEAVTLHDNTARNGAGGGLHGKWATLKLRADGVAIRNNIAYRGGGIAGTSANVYVGAYGDELPFAAASGLVVEGNRAADGGGIAMLGSGWLFDAQELIVRNNRAWRYGGGIYGINGQFQMGRDYPNYWRVQCAADQFCSRIEGNLAGDQCPGTGAQSNGHGGGAYFDNVSIHIHQTLIVDNCAFGNAALFTWGPSTRLESVVIARNRIRDRSGTINYTGNDIVGFGSRAGDPTHFLRVVGMTIFDNHTVKSDQSLGTTVAIATANGQPMLIGIASDQTNVVSGPATTPCLITGLSRPSMRDADHNDFRPLDTTALVDACASSTFATDYTGIDLQPRCTDHPGYDRGGSCDIGAAEAPIDPFVSGFRNGFE